MPKQRFMPAKMAPLSEVRWGIIGCGQVTEVKSGPALQKAGHSRLVAVMRRDAALARDYALRHNVPQWYSDAAALISDPEVDAIYIATPPAFHRDYTLAAAAAGKPVYVEKPMSMSYAQSRDMEAACGEAGVPLFVAYYRRALPLFQTIKSLLEAGAVGRVSNVETRLYRSFSQRPGVEQGWRVDPSVAGGGHFADLGSHMIDLLQFFFGPVLEAEGGVIRWNRGHGTEDAVEAVLLTAEEARIMVDWQFDASREFDETRLVGESGEMIFSIFGDGRLRVVRGQEMEESLHPHPEHVQQPLIESVVNELRGAGQCPSTGASASRTDRVLDRLLGRSDG